MADNDLITQITDIVIQQTINQKIPTVVFLSDIGKNDFVKNLFWTIKGGNKDTSTFTPDDWKEVANIMTELSEIPLLLQETTNIDEMRTNAECFINEINKGKRLIIIASKDNIFTDIPFTKKENISIIGIKG